MARGAARFAMRVGHDRQQVGVAGGREGGARSVCLVSHFAPPSPSCRLAGHPKLQAWLGHYK